MIANALIVVGLVFVLRRVADDKRSNPVLRLVLILVIALAILLALTGGSS